MNPLWPHEKMLMDGVTGSSMCELGGKKNLRGTYKEFFSKDWRHVSIDLNGENGALKYDLEQSIPLDDIDGPFDVVTNFGTSEHVNDQYPCWENIHKLVKVGGTLISTTPLDWPKHGRWYPTFEWYDEFAALNHYEEEMRFKIIDKIGRGMACLRLKKTKDCPFMFPTAPMVEMTGGRSGSYVIAKDYYREA